MRDSWEEGDDYAKGHAVGKENTRLESRVNTRDNIRFGGFFSLELIKWWSYRRVIVGELKESSSSSMSLLEYTYSHHPWQCFIRKMCGHDKTHYVPGLGRLKRMLGRMLYKKLLG